MADAMKLYFNPVSSYSQKALMAFYEKDVPFEPVLVNLMDPIASAEYRKIHPIGKVPYLTVADAEWGVPESTIIIEYLDAKFPDKGPRLVPTDPELARETRLRDRFFDCYVNDLVSKIFFDGMRPEGKGDAFGVEQAKKRLEVAYGLLDEQLAGRTWAAGDVFTMADCSAAPALGYARMVQPFDRYETLAAYAARLFERPSFRRIMSDAAPILAQITGKK
jgi:glutathione S-transferase